MSNVVQRIARSFALAASVGLLAPALHAQAADKPLVKLRFQQAFQPSASDAPLYVAVSKGYFKDEGIEIEFRHSQDPSNAVSLVAVGEAQLGVSYPPDIMLAVEKGLPIKAVWSWYQTSPFGIVSLVDGANIQQPKDMIGKRIGLTSLPIDQLQFNAMIEKAGIKRSQIEVVNPGFSGGDLVGQRKLDGASGVPWYEIDGLKSVNLKPTMMLYRDHLGLEFPFLSLIVNAKYAQDHGDTIKAYLRAVKKGAEYTKANPDEALDILLKTVPSLDRKRQAVAMQTVAPLRESPATAANGAGYVDVPQIQKLADFLLERGALKTKLDASATFTNQYR